MIAPTAIMPRVLFCRERKRMTTYLLSFASAGLVAVTIWEGLS
jgi:hypothetical protein